MRPRVLSAGLVPACALGMPGAGEAVSPSGAMTALGGDSPSSGRTIWTRRGALAGITAMGMSLGACTSPKRTIRYRLTLEVNTPEGLRRASSVFEQRTWLEQGLDMRAYETIRRGEAGWIDLPGGKNLLFLLIKAYRGDDNRIWLGEGDYPAAHFFAAHWHARVGLEEDYLAFLKRLSETPPGASIDLVPDELPLLVTLKDVREPVLTVIDPRDLSVGLGQGIQFSRARLEITHDPLVWGLDARLSWLGEHRSGETSVIFERSPLVRDWEGNLGLDDTLLQAKDWR